MNYMGSKQRLAKDIVPIIQSYIDDSHIAYIEPFVGGANIIDKIKHPNKYGCDNNKYLISLLSYSQKEYNKLPESINRDTYNSVRKDYNDGTNLYEDWYIGLVGFCGSYKSKFFGGYADGKKANRDYPREMINNLRKQSENLNGINFIHSDFFDWDISKINNCVIYLDPPYVNTTDYITSKMFDYDSYYDRVRELSMNNIVICSEKYMPNDFKCIWKKEIINSINLPNGVGSQPTMVEKLYIYNK